MRLLQLLLAVAVVTLSATFAGAEIIMLCDTYGYDYTMPIPHNLSAPNSYWAIGDVDNINPAAVVTDPTNNWYTFVLATRPPTNVYTDAGWTYYEYVDVDSVGQFFVYEDPKSTGTLRDYGVNPANATAPSTFSDGTLLLGAKFTYLQIAVDAAWSTAYLYGVMDFYCGEGWGSLPCFTGWTFDGMAQEVGVPGGYIWAVDGEVYVEEEISTEETSWSGIKQMFK
jgi:hypothetical protein